MSRLPPLFALVLAAGCPGDPAPTDPDASTAADASPADAPPTRCDPSAPFGAVEPVVGLNLPGADDLGAQLTPDELTVFFTSDRANAPGRDYDLYVATRASVDEPFGAPVALDALRTDGFHEVSPTISADGLTIYFIRSPQPTTRAGDVWVAVRTSPAEPFGPPSRVDAVSTEGTESSPYLTATGLYLARDREPGDPVDLDLVYAPRGPSGELGEAVPLDGVNAVGADDARPVLSADPLRIYWASARADGNYDIWTAARPSIDAPFADDAPVAELNSVGLDAPNWLSPDGCTLYLTSQRAGDRSDIYVVRRPPPGGSVVGHR